MQLWKRLMLLLGRKPVDRELNCVNERLEHFDRALEAERRRRRMQLELNSVRRRDA